MVTLTHQHLHGTLPLTIFREGKAFVAYSPALDLSTAGRTLSEAKQRFTEAARIFFRELIDRGTVAEVLTDLGWEKTPRGFVPPITVASEEFDLRHATDHAHSLAKV